MFVCSPYLKLSSIKLKVPLLTPNGDLLIHSLDFEVRSGTVIKILFFIRLNRLNSK